MNIHAGLTKPSLQVPFSDAASMNIPLSRGFIASPSDIRDDCVRLALQTHRVSYIRAWNGSNESSAALRKLKHVESN